MINVNDLNIEREVMPLMDFTRNHFARSTLLHLLLHPLPNVSAITERQEILKGILFNWPVLKGYAYPRGDLPEVHFFLEKLMVSDETHPVSRFGYWLHWQVEKKKN